MIKWPHSLFRKRPPRPPRELVCVSYADADRMLHQNVGWKIAPEEDHNRNHRVVYLERDVPANPPEPR